MLRSNGYQDQETSLKLKDISLWQSRDYFADIVALFVKQTRAQHFYHIGRKYEIHTANAKYTGKLVDVGPLELALAGGWLVAADGRVVGGHDNLIIGRVNVTHAFLSREET